MSTILDALRKVERERESPRDQLHHAPEPTPKRGRRVSTMTIVVCAVLGFGVGAGVALWRDAAPEPEQVAVVVPPAPAIPAPPAPPAPAAPRAEAPASAPAAPAPEAAAGGMNPEAALQAPGARPPAAPAAENAAQDAPETAVLDGSAIEPSPFERASDAPGAAAAVPGAADGEQLAALGGELPDDDMPPLDDELVLPDVVEVPPEDAVDQAAIDEPEAAPPQPVIDTGRSPTGAPRVTLSFLQWSADPARRFAFISIDGAPSQRVREGESAGGVTVDQITADGVQLRHAETQFIIRPRH